MNYMLLLMGEEPDWEEISPEEAQANIDEMGKYNADLEAAGAMVTGGGLESRSTATVVRFDLGGETTVTDGPFIETKEQLMGFWIIECANLDEALAWAKKVPLKGASIEVRPLIGTAGEDVDGEELIRRGSGQGS
ncbi:MAG: hypothetical protein QOE75_1413 [Solirubrobacterales bacterium]|jgi:hypothetical protein|nr:hypothetical protein [Solirubrobacterales bacterium]